MVKVSINRFVSSRVVAVRSEFKAATQKLRKRTLDKLEKIFRVATKVARGEVRHQRIGGKMVSIGLVQRKRWFRVAEHVALTMQSVASNIDEKEICARLNELERLVNDVKSNSQ